MTKLNLQDENWLNSKIKRLKRLLTKARNCDKKRLQERITTYECFLDDLNTANVLSRRL